MYRFITENQLISFLTSYDINYLVLEPYQQAVLLILANILYVIVMFIMISIIYKIVCRIIRWFV